MVKYMFKDNDEVEFDEEYFTVAFITGDEDILYTLKNLIKTEYPI